MRKANPLATLLLLPLFISGCQRQVFAEFNGMNIRMGQILAGYSDDQLDTIADFLHRTTAAGRASSDEIAGLQSEPARESAAGSLGRTESASA